MDIFISLSKEIDCDGETEEYGPPYMIADYGGGSVYLERQGTFNSRGFGLRDYFWSGSGTLIVTLTWRTTIQDPNVTNMGGNGWVFMVEDSGAVYFQDDDGNFQVPCFDATSDNIYFGPFPGGSNSVTVTADWEGP